MQKRTELPLNKGTKRLENPVLAEPRLAKRQRYMPERGFAFSRVLCALRDPHRVFLSQPSGHYLAGVFALPECELLQRAVVQWENQVESLSLYRLNNLDSSHDSSIVSQSLAVMKQHWEQIRKAQSDNALWLVDMLKRKRLDHNTYDESGQNKMLDYLKYAEQATELLHNDQPTTRWVSDPSLVEAVFFAAKAGHTSMTLLLLEFFFECQKCGKILPVSNIKHVDQLFEKVINFTAYNGRDGLLSTLLHKYQPDVHQKVYEGGSTLLQVAAYHGTPDTVQCILGYIETRGDIEKTLEQEGDREACEMVIAAMYAVKRGNVRSFDMLLPYLNTYQDSGVFATLLYNAVNVACFEIVRTLIEKLRVDPNCVNEEGDPPMYAAIQNENFKLVKYLIGAGADTEVRNSKGETALMSAVACHHVEIITLLVNALANVSATNAGRSLIMYAEHVNFTKAVTYLTEVERGRAEGNVLVGRVCIYSFFTTQPYVLPEPIVASVTSYLGDDFRV